MREAINASLNRPHFILGGHGPSADPEYFMNKMGADAVVVGTGTTVTTYNVILLLPLFMVVAYTAFAYLLYVLGIAAANAQGVGSLKGIFSAMVSIGIIFAVLLMVLYAAYGSLAFQALAGGAGSVPY